MIAQTTQLAMMEKMTADDQDHRRELLAADAHGRRQPVGQEVSYTDADGKTVTGIADRGLLPRSRSAGHRRRSQRGARRDLQRHHPAHARTRPANRPLRTDVQSTYRKVHHASFALLRHLRTPLAPDHARRHRQQHRQRQHRGFKSSAVQFQDTLSQVVTERRRRPQAEAGGTNPAQVGLGVQVAGISTNFAQGSAQATGKGTDMMISGDGFFVTQLGRRDAVHPRRRLRLRRRGPPRHRRRRRSCRAGTAVNGKIPIGGAVGNITPSAAGHDPRQGHHARRPGRQPAGRRRRRHRPEPRRSRSTTPSATPRTLDADLHQAPARAGTSATATAAGATAPLGLRRRRQPHARRRRSSPSAASTVDLVEVTGFAKLTTVAVNSQDGSEAGTLDRYTISGDGTLVGTVQQRRDHARSRRSPWPPSPTPAAWRRPAPRPTGPPSTPAQRGARRGRRPRLRHSWPAATWKCRTSTCRRSSPT